MGRNGKWEKKKKEKERKKKGAERWFSEESLPDRGVAAAECPSPLFGSLWPRPAGTAWDGSVVSSLRRAMAAAGCG